MSKFIGKKEIRIIGKLMGLTTSKHFPTALRRAIRAKIRFSTFLIVNFSHNCPPRPLYQWIPNAQLKSIYLKQYIEGDYPLDPYYQYSQGAFKAGLHRLNDIAPDRYFASEYYQRYYRKTQLKDEVGILVGLSNGDVAHLSFSRDLSDLKFSSSEMKGLIEFAPILTELIRQHCEAMVKERPNPEHRRVSRPPLHQILFEFTRANFIKGLTKREAEITALVLQGHSSLSISLRLEISMETVKVHRKNIYRKLQISTQAELFMKLSGALN